MTVDKSYDDVLLTASPTMFDDVVAELAWSLDPKKTSGFVDERVFRIVDILAESHMQSNLDNIPHDDPLWEVKQLSYVLTNRFQESSQTTFVIDIVTGDASRSEFIYNLLSHVVDDAQSALRTSKVGNMSFAANSTLIGNQKLGLLLSAGSLLRDCGPGGKTCTLDSSFIPEPLPCDQPVNSPCHHDAVCIDTTWDSYRCDCLGDWWGEECNRPVQCFTGACENKATCVQHSQSFSCDCLNGYIGEFCETPCPLGYEGVDCQTPSIFQTMGWN